MPNYSQKTADFKLDGLQAESTITKMRWQNLKVLTVKNV